ncbi:hypothetical protein JB92DRAFT_3114699 [Gautieria morchelliformis]|nr:hypothetical protein JB92DRAFT_3114699 [Gautieria morchelliformis]
MEPKRLALQMESYVVSGLEKRHQPTCLGRKIIVSQCRQMIQEGLAAILLKHNILDKPFMNYDNYERKVAERWGAVLLGWPLKKIVNLAKAGTRQELDHLHRTLKGGECNWEMLNAGELEERIANNRA